MHDLRFPTVSDTGGKQIKQKICRRHMPSWRSSLDQDGYHKNLSNAVDNQVQERKLQCFLHLSVMLRFHIRSYIQVSSNWSRVSTIHLSYQCESDSHQCHEIRYILQATILVSLFSQSGSEELCHLLARIKPIAYILSLLVV